MAHHELLIIGTGSGNSILTPDFDDVDVAIVERDVFGGTCLNRGCIPSKMFVYAADVAYQAAHSAHLGLDTQFNRAEWPAIRDRVFARIDPIAAGGKAYRESLPNVTVYQGDARFTANKTIEVSGRTITADSIVLAAGARPNIPDVPGLADVGYHTSDTIMRIEAIPDRLVVIGGGFIACELSHVFGSFGSHITMLVRGDTLLRFEDDDIAMRYTELSGKRFDVRCHTRVLAARRVGDEIELDVSTDGERSTVRCDMVLVATGRDPNGRQLGVEHRADARAEPQVGAADDAVRDPAGPVVAARAHRRDAVDEFGLADAAQFVGTVLPVHLAAFDEDRVRHLLAAGRDHGEQFRQQEALRLPEQARPAHDLPQMQVRIDDPAAGLERGFVVHRVNPSASSRLSPVWSAASALSSQAPLARRRFR